MGVITARSGGTIGSHTLSTPSSKYTNEEVDLSIGQTCTTLNDNSYILKSRSSHVCGANEHTPGGLSITIYFPIWCIKEISYIDTLRSTMLGKLIL